MIRTAIDQITQMKDELEALAASIESTWDDSVSKHISANYLDALKSECDTFCSSAYAEVESLTRNEESLIQLANKY